MSAKTDYDDRCFGAKYDAPTPTSGNDEVAAMCEAAGHDERLVDGALYLKAAALLRKLDADYQGALDLLQAQTDKITSLDAERAQQAAEDVRHRELIASLGVQLCNQQAEINKQAEQIEIVEAESAARHGIVCQMDAESDRLSAMIDERNAQIAELRRLLRACLDDEFSVGSKALRREIEAYLEASKK